MTRIERLRRVIIVCHIFARNLAYYRTAWNTKHQFLLPKTNFWKTINGNCLDHCVLEWCKLFGDKKSSSKYGEHFWKQIVTDTDTFEKNLLHELEMTAEDFEDYRIKMRDYRDKFVAHLDSDNVMIPPLLNTAKTCVWFYYSYIVAKDSLSGLARNLDRYYESCEREAIEIYNQI